MVIGGEDGSDSFSDDRGSDDSSGWRLRGWAASAARGGVGVVALGGRWVWMRSGRVQSESRFEEGGACLARGGGGSRGRDAGGGFGCVSRRRVRDETREGSSGWARREGGGRVSSGRRGVARTRERRRPQQRRRGRQDRTGTGSDSIRGGDGIGGFCDTDSNDDRDGEDRDSDDGDSRGRFECGDVGRDSTERFEGAVAVGDEVRDRGQQQRQGRRQQLQRRGRQRQHQRRPGTATTARTGTATTATATAGAMASCVEGTSRATSERDRTADSNAGWPHRVVRRRFDVDETRTVFGTVREEGAWPGGGHAVGRHF